MRKKAVFKNQNTNKFVREIISFLSKNRKKISPLLILTHDFPDPDSLASAYALQYLAHHAFNIQSRIVYRGIIGRVENKNMMRILDLPAHQLKANDLKKYSNIALVDTQPSFENNPFPSDRNATLVIDQHPSLKNSNQSADLLIVDPMCGATCVILAQTVQALKLPIPKRLATALSYGIISDTLNLYRASRKDIVDTYLAMLSVSDMHALARIQTPVYEKAYFSLLVKGIRNARFSHGLMICHLSKVNSPDVVSQTADFLLSYKEAKWVLTSGRFKNRLHVSLRTIKSNIPAAVLLRECFHDPEDAGGHGYIAGGSTKVTPVNDLVFRQEERRIEKKLTRKLFSKSIQRFRYIFKEKD